MLDQYEAQTIGILLAAGKGMRFDPSGLQNKLMQPLKNGKTVIEAAANNLLNALPVVLAVVRPGADELAKQLQDIGCKVTVCLTAEQGMAASLVHALLHTQAAAGWVIALADMPYVQPTTIAALLTAIEGGAAIAVPVHQGRRGNPVAFSRLYLQDLLTLRGDKGARSLMQTLSICEVPVNDAGISLDIDTQANLQDSCSISGRSQK